MGMPMPMPMLPDTLRGVHRTSRVIEVHDRTINAIKGDPT